MSACLILAAGIGSRMENPVINKGLLPISGKAIITHIIENVDCEEIIIAVGYKQEQVRDYCSCAHPNANIKFVTVDNFQGPGSGPGYSMWCCREYLQKPFYLVTADSYLGGKAPSLDCDWIGTAKVPDLENYATCKVDENGVVVDFKNKVKEDYFEWAFTGVLGIKDYEGFWKRFEEYKNLNPDKEVELVGALYKPFYNTLYSKNLDWVDIGRKSLYNEFYLKSKNFAEYNLKKIDIEEYIYKINDYVLKITTEDRIEAKKKRSINLEGLIPEICCHELKNVFSYKFVEGKTLYEMTSLEIYSDFLKWLETNLFNRRKEEPVDFKNACLNFYRKKTWNRLKSYCQKNKVSMERYFTINGDRFNIEGLWEKIDWKRLSENGICYAFHGDLNFGNVIYTDNKKYVLIDWREDFSGNSNGDLYYDLAKLYAGSLVNFYIANDRIDLVGIEGHAITTSYCNTAESEKFRSFYEEWINNNNYDLKKVRLLAGLIILSMSPLHPGAFGEYLFYFGLSFLNNNL
jgi:NDP-sugar pyrophosphorylase family protein